VLLGGRRGEEGTPTTLGRQSAPVVRLRMDLPAAVLHLPWMQVNLQVDFPLGTSRLAC
jgi:hypothetical protein